MDEYPSIDSLASRVKESMIEQKLTNKKYKTTNKIEEFLLYEDSTIRRKIQKHENSKLISWMIIFSKEKVYQKTLAKFLTKLQNEECKDNCEIPINHY